MRDAPAPERRPGRGVTAGGHKRGKTCPGRRRPGQSRTVETDAAGQPPVRLDPLKVPEPMAPARVPVNVSPSKVMDTSTSASGM